MPKTRDELRKDLTDKGFKSNGISENGYEVWSGPNGTKVTIEPSGEVIRTQRVLTQDELKKYPERQDYRGNRLPNQSHSTNHFVK